MDNTDLKILKLLKENARLPVSKIGEIVCLSSPAVSERIKKMEISGVITGYNVAIDQYKLGKNVMAYISIDVKKDQHAKFDAHCMANPAIVSFNKVIGTYYAVILVAVEKTSDLSGVLDSIKASGGIATHTSVIIQEVFHNKICIEQPSIG